MRRRAARDAIVRIEVEGGLRRLRRNFQRYHISHPATDDLRTIIAAILLRAGMSTSVTNASARSDTKTPNFHIAPDHSGERALAAALDHLADRLRVRSAGVVHMDEPLTSDTTDYSVLFIDTGGLPPFFGGGTANGPHRAYRQALRSEAPPIAQADVHSLDSGGGFALGQAWDHPVAEHGLAPIGRFRDIDAGLGGGNELRDAADSYLRQRTLDQDLGRLTAPPVCGLELLDVLTVSDVWANSTALLRRVRGITWRFDRPAGRYEQEIALGPV